MKNYLFYFFFLFHISFASSSIIKIDVNKLPIDLNKLNEWKYNKYDSAIFKNFGYNDSHWENKLPTLYFDELGNIDFKGLAWFRLKLMVDSTLVDEPLALEINHYGASEIYIDGKAIYKYGKIISINKTEYYDPRNVPLVFNFNSEGEHVIAIRYANFNAKRNYDFYDDGMAGFEIKLALANSAINLKDVNNIALSSIFMLLSGIFFAFCLIHIFMFLLNRKIFSNLYFSILMFCLSSVFVISLVNFTISDVTFQLNSYYFLKVFSILTFVSLSGFINALFSKNKIRFLIVALFAGLSLLLQYFENNWYGKLILILVIFILIESIVVVIKAIINKIKGAWIIGTGILLFAIFILTAVLFSLLNDGEMILDNSNIVGKIVVTCLILTIISIPLSMSIYLAWNFSSMNKSLIIQLEQVKVLSEKNLEQEQEKQRILENKKTELESQVLERTAELLEEKKKSDDLLLNILPAEIAEELKEKGSAIARDYDKVTVMFTDFKDFTKISEQLTPAALVKEIDSCFSAFDQIIQKHGIEKIKTIGDAYMCVGGLPIPNSNHALNTVKAAIDIRDFMKKHNQEKAAKGEHQFRIRIGIHTGSVVAGIVGIKKFAYDIWGDTVNIASRIESSGEADKINISESTFELVKNNFKCTYRGKIEAKNKGQIDMYFVED
ncbi:MAG TPA: adenylate/guanylate cyclase domain-containing protein [Bacteroidia bacterium]|nr:adenylate/guanylate cyclase domain-containing protein [Bacteroidia bacterium]